MTIRFDKTLYSEKAVKQAIADYASLAVIIMTNSPECCVCTIVRSEYPLETTALEFSNYVLNLTVMGEKKE